MKKVWKIDHNTIEWGDFFQIFKFEGLLRWILIWVRSKLKKQAIEIKCLYQRSLKIIN